MHAFLALYDATGNARWLHAAEAAADYVETWMYAWTFPLADASPAYAHAGALGSSLIATGQSGADTFLAFEAYDFYRLHLFRDDAKNHYLNVAQFLANNTELSTQVSGVAAQQFGYSYDGLVGEATDFSFLCYLGGSSTISWLPWLTEAEIEPLEGLQQSFGSPSISVIEQQPLRERLRENVETHPVPGSIGWGTGSQRAKPPASSCLSDDRLPSVDGRASRRLTAEARTPSSPDPRGRAVAKVAFRRVDAAPRCFPQTQAPRWSRWPLTDHS